MSLIKPEIRSKFFSKTQPKGDCLEWTGARNAKGYGICFLLGKQMAAHRVSYTLNYGNIPKGIFVCHHCDNKWCVKPEHLFLGHPKVNSDDYTRKHIENSVKKPAKPYPDFPLYAHANGQWAKTILGVKYYFGVWEDPDAAYAMYEKVRHDLYAGREPLITSSAFLTVGDMCNLFLAAKLKAVEINELNQSTYNEYRRSSKRMIDILGRKRNVESLSVGDFSDARTQLAKQCKSPVTLKNELTRWRVILKWANESGTVGRLIPFASALKRPPARALRAESSSREKLFTAEEVKELTKSATGYMRPAIFLGINCGMGNRDCVTLRWKEVEGGWLDCSRPKTGVRRRARLWPETVKALNAWRKQSPKSEYICCKESGGKFLGDNTPIAHLFDEIAADAKVARNGRGFYCLRHTYRTVADSVQDQPAIMYTMGHFDYSISGVYRQTIDDSRLIVIANKVKEWLANSSNC